ncbi:MAG TPA: 4a-hydroxytetrahydrobiopterin dehydratase [Anaeromyxobacteraceae bacterium]
MLTAREPGGGLAAGRAAESRPPEPSKLASRLGDPPGWRRAAGGSSIERRFAFPTYVQLARFVQTATAVAAFVDYPPDLRVREREATVRLRARDAAGLGADALELAAAVNRCAAAATGPGGATGAAEAGPGGEEGGSVDTDEAARRAQERCRGVLAKVVEVERELQEIFASLPEIEKADSDAMTNQKRPRTLLFFLRGMLAALQVDEVLPLREALERLVGRTAEDLEREWQAERS